MCFCASASFAAGAGLAAIGAATIGLSRKGERLLAVVPLLFAVQQLTEGSQWIVNHPSIASLVLGYAFLFFALLLWPIYIPLAVYQLENDPHNKTVFKWLFGAGAVTSFALLVALLSKPPSIVLLANSIDYQITTPLGWVGVLLYLAATCGPLTISSHPRIRWFGAAVTLAIIVSGWFYRETFISVWCFFSAILSALIFLFYYKRRYG